MELINLSMLKKGEAGIIRAIDESLLPKKIGLSSGEVEMRLLEMGFVEGSMVKVLYFGAIGHDPIGVRINNNTSIIALRKNEATTVLVERV